MNYTQSDFNSLYFTLKKTILQKTSYDINKDATYKKNLNTIVQNILKSKQCATPQHVNTIVHNSASKKFIKSIQEKMNNKSPLQRLPNRPLNTDPRPEFTNKSDLYRPDNRNNIQMNLLESPVPQKMCPEVFSRQVNQSSSNEMSLVKESVEDRMNKLMQERGIKKEVKSIEEKLTSTPEIDMNNDFFRSLYENKIQDNNPFITKETQVKEIKPIENKPKQFTNQSEANKLPDYEMENLPQQQLEDNNMKTTSEQIKQEGTELYRNTSFHNQRELGKLIYIDTGALGADNSINNISVNLVEPVVIDGASDVYVEFIGLHDLKTGTGVAQHIEGINLIGLKIDEIPVNVGTTNSNLLGYYLFPNETYGTNDNSADVQGAEGDASQSTRSDATTYTIKLKSNYYTTVTSGKYSTFTISLLGLTFNLGADNYDFLKANSNAGRLVIGLFFKKRT